MGLKEATAEKHKLAERMPFNGRMYTGKLTDDEYCIYLNLNWQSLLHWNVTLSYHPKS